MGQHDCSEEYFRFLNYFNQRKIQALPGLGQHLRKKETTKGMATLPQGLGSKQLAGKSVEVLLLLGVRVGGGEVLRRGAESNNPNLL